MSDCERATWYYLADDVEVAERELAEERWLLEDEGKLREMLDEHGPVFVQRVVARWERERAGSPFGCADTEGEPRIDEERDGLHRIAI